MSLTADGVILNIHVMHWKLQVLTWVVEVDKNLGYSHSLLEGEPLQECNGNERHRGEKYELGIVVVLLTLCQGNCSFHAA